MSHDSYRPPTPARTGPIAPPPPTDPVDRVRAAVRVVLPGGLTCRSWDDFLAVSAQRWDELRDHLVTGQLGAALARAGQAEWIPDPNAPDSPDQRLDDWLESLPITRSAVPELDVQPSRIDLLPSASSATVQVRIANVGYRLLRFRIGIEPADVGWLALPPSADGLEMVTVEESTIALTVMPPDRKHRSRLLTATLRIESNGGERSVPITLQPMTTSPARGGNRRAGRWLGLGIGAVVGGLSWPLVWLADRWLPGGPPGLAAGLVIGILGLGVGAGLVGRKASGMDRLAGCLAGLIGGLIASDVAILAAESLPGAPWWVTVAAWSGLGSLVAAATGLNLTLLPSGTEGGSR